MLNVEIISNGPSARLYPGRCPWHHTVIGVNWAWIDLKYQINYWCFCDAQTYEQNEPPYPVKIVTMGYVLDKLLKKLRGKKLERIKEDIRLRRIIKLDGIPLPRGFDNRPLFNSWSGTAALTFAGSLRPGRIIAYGADMDGEKDHRGDDHPNRNENRWGMERELWTRLAFAIQQQHGTHIERVTEDGIKSP